MLAATGPRPHHLPNRAPRLDSEESRTSKRLLLISLLCLLVPVALSQLAPDLVISQTSGLVWLLPLLPPFLLSFHRGWRGAAAALAVGMVAVTGTHGVLLLRGRELPPQVMLWVTGALLLVALGSAVSSTLLLRSRDEAEQLALSDPGTGLPNRRSALLNLHRAFASAQRGEHLTLVMFDLDHFKEVNDRHGHQAGDEVLLEFARILAARTRRMNQSARIGGEEFLASLERCDLADARSFAEEIRTAFHEATAPWGGITVSAGVAEYEPGMASADVLLAAADQALYAAKQAGRNRVAIAGEDRAPTGTYVSMAHLRPRIDDGGASGRVLVVDDDHLARRSLVKALRRLGYEVLEESDPERAMQIVRGLDEPLDILITDVIMPTMSGFRLVEVLTRQVGALRVLYLSGYALEDAGWRGTPGQVRAFLQKPVSVEDLSGALTRLLDQPLSQPEDLDDPDGPLEKPEPEDGGEPDGRPPFVAAGATPNLVSMAEVRLRHLGYTPIERASLEGLVTRGGRPAELVVVVLEPPYHHAAEILHRFRSECPPDSQPPLLVLAPELSADLESRFHELFPAAFRTLSTGLGELGLEVQHLTRVGVLNLGRDEERSSLEARIQARSAELESAHRDILLRLARAAEFRDDLTGRHAERVGYFAAVLARHLGFSQDQSSILGQAAPLHDLGKIAIPDAILNKPGRLTDTERALMERHCEIGASLLRGSRHPLIQEAERIALNHHERWDGTGYPRRLAGEDIPRSARIVAVADVFDTITHTRPYRIASSLDGALGIIKEGRGSHFEPEAVYALDELIRRGELETDPDEALVAPPDTSPMSTLEIREMLAELD